MTLCWTRHGGSALTLFLAGRRRRPSCPASGFGRSRGSTTFSFTTPRRDRSRSCGASTPHATCRARVQSCAVVHYGKSRQRESELIAYRRRRRRPRLVSQREVKRPSGLSRGADSGPSGLGHPWWESGRWLAGTMTVAIAPILQADDQGRMPVRLSAGMLVDKHLMQVWALSRCFSDKEGLRAVSSTVSPRLP